MRDSKRKHQKPTSEVKTSGCGCGCGAPEHEVEEEEDFIVEK